MNAFRLLAFLTAFAVLGLAPAVSAQTTPAQLERIATLVEEGKLDEAKIRAETLLEIYPDDPTLAEIQRLLREKLAAQPAPAPPPSPSPSPAAPPPAAPPVPEVLGWEDRTEIDTVSRQAEAALKTPDVARRKQELETLLLRPVPDRAGHSPAWIPYWRSRAAAALECDDVVSGCRAAQVLARLSDRAGLDPQLPALWDSLERKGWTAAALAETVDARAAEYGSWLGVWTGTVTRRLDTRDYTASMTLRVRLSSDLSVIVQCEAISESDYFGRGKFTDKHRLPGIHSVTKDGESERGEYQLLRHFFSADKSELTLFYRYELNAMAIAGYRQKRDREGTVVVRLSASRETLTLSENPFSDIFVKTLDRPKP